MERKYGQLTIEEREIFLNKPERYQMKQLDRLYFCSFLFLLVPVYLHYDQSLDFPSLTPFEKVILGDIITLHS